MSTQFIANHNLEALLEHLRRYAELHGPVRGEDGVVRFAALTQETLPDLSALRTLLPPVAPTCTVSGGPPLCPRQLAKSYRLIALPLG